MNRACIVGILVLLTSPAIAQEPAKQSAVPVAADPPQTIRVRDIARIESVRANQIVGYGLVVGLNGTGDSQQSPFTIQAVVSMLKRFGVTIDIKTIKTKNTAAVIVTADVPAFYKNGSKLDVTVSSLGDATSLQGATLLQTPLLGADEQIYAVAQGPVSIGGFSAASGGSATSKNHPTTGRVPGGALIEKEIRTDLLTTVGFVRINLNEPDFENATLIAAAINTKLGPGSAFAEDSASVKIKPPAGFASDTVRLISELGDARFQPVIQAKVVLNERTGTVIIGGNVRIAPVAVAHGALTVEIQTDLNVSQPAPLSNNGQTVVTPQTSLNATENKASLVELKGGATLADLVKALNSLRVTPRDLVAIIQAIKNAGALYAELEIQ